MPNQFSKNLLKLPEFRPELMHEWNWCRNDTRPEEFSAHSGKSVWWKCSVCGYEWKTSVISRTSRGAGCPVCAGKIVVAGYNDLQTKFPEVANEWNYERNGLLTPKEVTAKSGKKVWWKCSTCGYEWEARILSRTASHTGCPACAGRIVIQGRNDLQTKFPEVANEWNYERNGLLTPKEVTAKSGKKVWWKCSICGYEWEANIGNRTQNSSGCPICSKKRGGRLNSKNALEKKGSLLDNFPELCNEWNYKQNGDLQPSDVTSGANKSVWWTCSVCGHEWKARIGNRTRNNSGCPKCDSERQTSFPEQAIHYYFEQLDASSENRNTEYGKEVDILIKSKKIAIEYDGWVYHRGIKNKEIFNEKKQREDEKDRFFRNLGYRIIHVQEVKKRNHLEIWENGVKLFDEDGLDCLNHAIEELIRITGFEIVQRIDVTNDRLLILEKYKQRVKDNSALAKHPELLEQWDFEKNGNLNLGNFSCGSNVSLWWRCPVCGHSYKTSLYEKISRNSGCPVCAGKIVKKGYNDLATKRPDIVVDWDYMKNGDLSPDMFTVSSGEKVWWKCSICGYEWYSRIADRTYGYGCFECGKGKRTKHLSK